jgi:hypothetical protein
MTSKHTEPLLGKVSVGRGRGQLHFVDVGVEYAVDEADGGGFVGILIG